MKYLYQLKSDLSDVIHFPPLLDGTLVTLHLAGWPLLCMSSGQTFIHGLNKEKNKCWL